MTVSRDGQRLAFGVRDAESGSKPLKVMPAELWLISVQGGEPRKLDLAARNMRELCVHPDGCRIAFTSAGDESEAWVMENFLPGTK